ncbi:MAG: hypothetical protein NTW94_00425 [Legionellales bacterium]|nr:hypothetical protein [Legionellales bacterium]
MENTKKIIEKMQSIKQNLTIHITLGYLHSFALEQRIEDETYCYYLYDPNNSAPPKKLSSPRELVQEIQYVLEKIKLATLSRRYFFYENKNTLFSFYVYPEKIEDRIIPSLYQKIIESPYKDDENIKEILNLIDLYNSNLMAKNILLMQIIELMKKVPRAQFFFTEELREIADEMTNHLYSMGFMPLDHHKDKIKCFNYVKSDGCISLLHEVARIGDVAAVKALTPHSNLLNRSHQQIYQTPIDWSIMGSHPLILDIMLKEVNTHGLNKRQPVNYELVERVLRNRSNAFNVSNTESKAMGHAIFSMFNLIESHRNFLFHDNTKERSDLKCQLSRRRYSL